MDILFCNIKEYYFYNGEEKKEKNIGEEINNFTNCNDTYYGYVVSPGVPKTMCITAHFSNICNKYREDAYADDVLVVMFAKGKIVGWYKHARVYAKIQNLDDKMGRVYDTYNIVSNEVVLIPFEQRDYFGVTLRYIKYPTEDRDKKLIERVISYIDEYEKYLDFTSDKSKEELDVLDESKLIGEDKEHLAKYRVNQEKFRNKLIEKYKEKCSICQCGISMAEVLIASHIKPWADSDCNEKLLSCNGLLLCPNHDKLFDKFLISFDDDGKILISEELKRNSPRLFNISENSRIKVDESMKPFLIYHREKFFEKNK